MERYCQSCGLPMDDDIRGTEADGSRNDDYCMDCYQDGAFTDSMTMQQMISDVASYVAESGEMSEAEAKGILREFMPTLKRWSR